MSTSKLPDINKNFADWYNDIVYRAELADLAPVRGCIVIRPYGYAIWENMQSILDKKIKDTGHQNAAFPLLIPQSFIQKEKEHVAGFSPELAVVTHAGGEELAEPLIVRPTSETIIHHFFAQWLKSYRDLPIKINQWCSVVRWEMRTRPFLRTTEFWWQEGHTAHETAEEAEAEARQMLAEYVDLIENYLGIAVVVGEKPPTERFAGADKTFAVEALMPDGKALQMCTSHLISQNFAKAFGMTFQNREGQLAYPYLTSWGATTRLIGAVIMVHGDQKGLQLPPAIAPVQVVIVPILKEDSKEKVLAAAKQIKELITSRQKGPADMHWHAAIRVHIDADENETPGAKFYKWEMKGVPVRIEVGPRDVDAGQAVIADRLGLAKDPVPLTVMADYVAERLAQVQREMYKRSHETRASMIHKREKLAEFKADLEEKGGFYHTGWCGSQDCETSVKVHKATIRCILPSQECKVCFACDQKSKHDIMIARAY